MTRNSKPRTRIHAYADSIRSEASFSREFAQGTARSPIEVWFSPPAGGLGWSRRRKETEAEEKTKRQGEKKEEEDEKEKERDGGGAQRACQKVKGCPSPLPPRWIWIVGKTEISTRLPSSLCLAFSFSHRVLSPSPLPAVQYERTSLHIGTNTASRRHHQQRELAGSRWCPEDDFHSGLYSNAETLTRRFALADTRR